MARMIAAHTKHGDHSAAKPAQRRHIRTAVVRVRLLCAAHRVQAYLPPALATHPVPMPCTVRNSAGRQACGA